jgi:hypothetical protein
MRSPTSTERLNKVDNPRQYDSLGTMMLSHRRYNLGDANAGDDLPSKLRNEYNLPTLLSGIEKLGGVALTVYGYDHSVFRISTESFIGRAHHAEWDSGILGVIYTMPQKIRKHYGVKRISKDLRRHVAAYLKIQVDSYDRYLNNEDDEGGHACDCGHGDPCYDCNLGEDN